MSLHWLIFVGILATPALSYSSGAPESACATLIPGHKNIAGQKGNSPYQIIIEPTTINAGGSLQLTIKGNSAANVIRGYIIKALVGNTEVGKFNISPNDPFSQPLNCGNSNGSAATHKKIYDNPPNAITLSWTAPANLKETVVFHMTVAEDYHLFWLDQKSAPVHVV